MIVFAIRGNPSVKLNWDLFRKDKQQDPPVEHDLYVSLDDICKVTQKRSHFLFMFRLPRIKFD